jgi:hypothetical protein
MKVVTFCLMTGLAFGLPFAAAAQNVAKGTPADCPEVASFRAWLRRLPLLSSADRPSRLAVVT